MQFFFAQTSRTDLQIKYYVDNTQYNMYQCNNFKSMPIYLFNTVISRQPQFIQPRIINIRGFVLRDRLIWLHRFILENDVSSNICISSRRVCTRVYTLLFWCNASVNYMIKSLLIRNVLIRVSYKVKTTLSASFGKQIRKVGLLQQHLDWFLNCFVLSVRQHLATKSLLFQTILLIW